MPIAQKVYLTIVGAEDAIIYQLDWMSGFEENPPREDSLQDDSLHEFVMYASMDAVEETMWTNANVYLKVVDRFADWLIAAYLPPSHAKILLLFEPAIPIPTQSSSSYLASLPVAPMSALPILPLPRAMEDALRNLFVEIHDVYLRILLNPLYMPNTPIESIQFDERVRQLTKRFLL